MLSPRFLLIDDNSAGRFLISKTLLRHYPQALVQEFQELGAATQFLRTLPPSDHGTIVIAHKTDRVNGRELVSALRAAHASVPIVWTAERDQAQWAQAAGATRFLERDAWLLIGITVDDLV
jgi:CheY-like chemotaxis protein